MLPAAADDPGRSGYHAAVSAARPAPPPLAARPLRADEYDAWYRHVTDAYAEDIASNGLVEREAARRKAERDMATLLPDGLETANQSILVLEADGVALGRLWIGPREIDGRTVLYIWDVEIDAEHRGRGYGRQAMRLAEETARARGLTRIELNVFGGNHVARSLYRSLGYGERAVAMSLDLGDSSLSR